MHLHVTLTKGAAGYLVILSFASAWWSPVLYLDLIKTPLI